MAVRRYGGNRFTASPLHRFTASPLHRLTASPLHRFTASPPYRLTLAVPDEGDQITSVLQSLPPYALPAPAFPFRHLASQAGRAPIGGAREVALACFVAARLASDCGSDCVDLSEAGRMARCAGAKAWLGTLALPPAVRGPLLRCVESTAGGSSDAVARELSELAVAGASYLDSSSRAELDALAAALRG
jgi:hypothetical protein